MTWLCRQGTYVQSNMQSILLSNSSSASCLQALCGRYTSVYSQYMRVHAPIISANACILCQYILLVWKNTVLLWKMSVKLISIRYFSEREDSCSMPKASFGLSLERPTREGSPTTNEQNARGFGIYSEKFRALPWSYFVLSAIIIVVASMMSFSLLIFYASREKETLVTYNIDSLTLLS